MTISFNGRVAIVTGQAQDQTLRMHCILFNPSTANEAIARPKVIKSTTLTHSKKSV